MAATNATNARHTAPRRGRGRPRNSEADRAILEAAAELLATGGFEILTIDAVAAKVRCSKSTIYRRWKSKLRLAIDALAELPDPPVPDRGSVRADLRELLGGMIEIFNNTPAVAVMQRLIGERARNPELASLLDEAFQRRRDGLCEVLRRAILRGELPAETDIELTMDLIVGPLLTRLFCTGAPITAELLDALVETALVGCGAASS
jgi:AcrR family transcriptional regulator